jgi:hypothetical protein
MHMCVLWAGVSLAEGDGEGEGDGVCCVVQGYSKSGDTTVPYCSLSWAHLWHHNDRYAAIAARTTAVVCNAQFNTPALE